MSNDSRTLAVLGVVFLALIGAFIFQTGRLAEESQIEPVGTPTQIPLQRVYPQINNLGDTVTAIQLRDPATDTTFTMARDGNNEWVVPTANGVRNINQDEAAVIAGTMPWFQYSRTIELEDDADIAQFGFRPEGDFYIQFVTDNGDEHIVAVGAPSTTSPEFYAFIDDRPEIYLLERSAVDYLAAQFRNPPFE